MAEANLLKFASLNVNGLRSDGTRVPKRRKIFSWLKQLGLDIICLQETHSDENSENIWRNEWGGLGYFASGSERSRGVAILIKPGLPIKVSRAQKDLEGRYIIIEIEYFGVKTTLGNVYGPNTDEPAIFGRFCTTLETYGNELMILAGDFNLCMDVNLDRMSPTSRIRNHIKCKEIISSFAEENNLVDVWRVINPGVRKYTFERLNPPSKSRIDFFLVSECFLSTVNGMKAEITDGYLADHKMVTIEAKVSSSSYGRSYWKFNNTLLKDDDFTNLIRSCIPQILEQNDRPECSRTLLLETLLTVLRGEIISYASHRKKTMREKIDIAEKTIFQLTNKHDLSAQENNDLNSAKNERDNIITEITERNMFLTAARWKQFGERGSKYFHNLKRRNTPNSTIKSLAMTHSKNSDAFSEDVKEMLTECHTFFREMYRAPTDSLQIDQSENLLASIKRLNEREAQLCEGTLTETEMKTALHTLKNGTAPGPSGYTVEFFKFFWEELKSLVTQTFQEIQQSGKMKASLKQSVTILIPKRGKDQRRVENLRPISLLDVPYKIFTKAIALRINHVIKTCIEDDQTGFIKGRYIGENIRLILDLREHCSENNKDALLLACDFRKAFDSVRWDYLQHVLKCYGFGPDLRKLVNIVYCAHRANLPRAVVQLNGFLSEPYTIETGIRQGCPLSCFLFILCIEPLLAAIRASEAIQGITIDQTDIKVTAYADDVTVILDGSPVSLRACSTLFERFEKISGLHLNRNKTKPLWIGKNPAAREPICEDLNLDWGHDAIEILGITIPSDPTANIGELNYPGKVKKLKARLSLWSARYLTPYGKVHLVKSEAVSQLIYLMSVLPSPPKVMISEIEKSIFNFIWGGKRDKIKRATLRSKYKAGGLQVPDITAQAQSLKMMWVKKYLDSQNSAKWKILLRQKLSFVARHVNAFECTFSRVTINRRISNIFWREVFSAWMKLKSEPETGEEVLKQVIWLNENMDFKESQLFRRQIFIQKGMFKIGHIYSLSERRLLTANEISLKFGMQPIFALALLKSMPLKWKDLVERDKPSTFEAEPITIAELRTKTSVAKWAYNLLFNGNSPPDKAILKWERDLGVQRNFCWETAFNNIYNTSDDISLRWLQFRIIHRIIPTNKLLKLFGIIQSDKCQRCPEIEENLMHLFYSCPKVLELWQSLSQICRVPPLDGVSVMLNVSEGSNSFPKRSMRLLILIAKDYVWQCRRRSLRPNLRGLAQVFVAKYKVEKYICGINDDSVPDVWDPILNVLKDYGSSN